MFNYSCVSCDSLVSPTDQLKMCNYDNLVLVMLIHFNCDNHCAFI